MIYTYRNFTWTLLQMKTWWYIHTATLYHEHVMIYTYCNFVSTFLLMNTWWYIHTATLYQLSCTRTRDDIYILQLYIKFLADEHLMIYTYRNFISTLLQMNTWWHIHTLTLCQLSCTRTRDEYIAQLYVNFPSDEHVVIYTYCNVFSTFLQMNMCWYIHAATLYHFLFDEHVMIDIFGAALYQFSCR